MYDSSMFLSLVIPAYDELENLRILLPSIFDVLKSCGDDLEVEILVVLPVTASPEEIREVNELGATALARNPSNSFGDAIRSGIANSSPKSDFTIFMDADGSHQPTTLKKLIEADSRLKVVVASRYIKGGNSENSLPLKLMSRSLNLAYSLVLGLKCRDVSTNFKRFISGDLRQVTLISKNFDVVEELLFQVKLLNRDKFSLLEIPDTFYERAKGKSKRKLGPFILSYLVSLFRLRLKYRKKNL